jgi:hypothetical protein
MARLELLQAQKGLLRPIASTDGIFWSCLGWMQFVLECIPQEKADMDIIMLYGLTCEQAVESLCDTLDILPPQARAIISDYIGTGFDN